MREVLVNFSGGSQGSYVVTFDDEGEHLSVDVVVKRGMDYGPFRRKFWHRRTGRDLSELGKIVVNRAANFLKDR